MHENGGNQGSLDYPGPLGSSLNVSSYAATLRVLFWGSNGGLSAACSFKDNGTTIPALCAVDPNTLEVLSRWQADNTSETLNFDYSELVLELNDFLINSKQGNLYVVHRDDNNGPTPTFTTSRKIALASHSILGSGEALLNSLFDISGNIWFTSGAIVGNEGDPVQNSSTVGYVEPNGTIHAVHMPNEIIENGISVSGTTMFIQTGPSGSNDHANATGYLYAFTAGVSGNSSDVVTLWRQPYSAGSGYKPGGFARGSGSSPSLLGNDFIAITDNADEQVHMLAFDQKTGTHVCSVPIFSPGASAVDNALLNAFDGKEYGVIALSDYNASLVYKGSGDINGAFNNMTTLVPGLTRVSVLPQVGGGAKCSVKWEAKVRSHSVPVLSLQTGLLYALTQDETLALSGEYVWYVVALEFATGNEVWRVRSGSGGIFNDNYLPGTLGPDGSFFQGVLGGLIVVKDGENC